MLEAILIVVVLIVSVVIHENAHGWTALALGDTTAKQAGRLTLNPIKHLDPVGSVIMPAFLAFTTHSAFGYAKPVPIGRHLLRGKDRGFAVVALAGPASNVAIAVVAILLARLTATGSFARDLMFTFVNVNIFLAAFNLVPIPPLDGSRLLRLVLRPKGIEILDKVEPFGFVILLLLVALIPEPLFRVVGLIASVLVRLLPV